MASSVTASRIGKQAMMFIDAFSDYGPPVIDSNLFGLIIHPAKRAFGKRDATLAIGSCGSRYPTAHAQPPSPGPNPSPALALGVGMSGTEGGVGNAGGDVGTGVLCGGGVGCDCPPVSGVVAPPVGVVSGVMVGLRIGSGVGVTKSRSKPES